MIKLYSYYRSSASYRLRIAFNHKQIEYETQTINLLKGEHKSEEYLKINPQGFVPSVQVGDDLLVQSPAILDWAEDVYSSSPLYPSDALERAKVKALCHIVACDIHPVNNLRILKYLSTQLDVVDEDKNAWYRHWIEQGFSVLEPQLLASPYSLGGEISMLDVYLIPQVYNALRFKVDMTPFSNIMQVYDHCNQLPAFIDAMPENQVDCV